MLSQPWVLKAAIVDLDGTLVDTLGDFEMALNRTLSDLDLPSASRDLVARSVGKGSEHLILSVLQHQLGLLQASTCAGRSAESLFEAAWQRYQHHYLAINGQYALVYPGVIEGLTQMREAGLQLACLTNKPLAFARSLLASKGLDSFFGPVFGGDSFDRKKPDPLPVLKTCEALHNQPAQTLMVGDSINDFQAARAAGCPVVLLRYGYNHGQPVDGLPADGHWDTLTQWALWQQAGPTG
jgi:phosphoglycolate phosphatase